MRSIYKSQSLEDYIMRIFIDEFIEKVPLPVPKPRPAPIAPRF